MHEKKPLYRKVNSRAVGARHGHGGEYRWSRNTKRGKRDERSRGSMHAGLQHGLDYTPLFKFLLSKVGSDWSEVHREAVARLDRPDPIFWMVALSRQDGEPFVRIGESSYYSGLYVDEDNRLANGRSRARRRRHGAEVPVLYAHLQRSAVRSEVRRIPMTANANWASR